MKFNRHHWDQFLSFGQWAGAALMLAALPLSNTLMSVGMITLGCTCFLQFLSDGSSSKSKARLQRFTKSPQAWIISLLFAPVALGLLWSEDLSHGMWDVRMKLPILVLPFILSCLNPFSTNAIRQLKGIFLLSLLFSVSYCLLIYHHVIPKAFDDVREISVFISHIRFSLLLVVGLLIAWDETWKRSSMGKIFSVLIASYVLYFLFVIESLTGIAALALALTIIVIRYVITTKHLWWRRAVLAIIGGMMIGSGWYLYHCYHAYFTPIHSLEFTERSRLGEIYDHNLDYMLIEEGKYPYTYIAWGEMYEAWSQRSERSLDSLDDKGGLLKGTLIRYATSCNVHKDYDGISSLNDEDIERIEAGETSIHDGDKNPIRRRIDRVLFEYANARIGGNSSGHSVFQRFEFWKAGWYIFIDHPLMGVGTGDTKMAFAQKYDQLGSSLDQAHRLRAHNQYLTFALTYGIFGFLLILCALVIPLFRGGMKGFMYPAFVAIAAMSFVTEDTLESQAGVMFFVVFMILLHPQFNVIKTE